MLPWGTFHISGCIYESFSASGGIISVWQGNALRTWGTWSEIRLWQIQPITLGRVICPCPFLITQFCLSNMAIFGEKCNTAFWVPPGSIMQSKKCINIVDIPWNCQCLVLDGRKKGQLLFVTKQKSKQMARVGVATQRS